MRSERIVGHPISAGALILALVLSLGCGGPEEKDPWQSNGPTAPIEPPEQLVASATGAESGVASRSIASKEAFTPLIKDVASRTYAMKVFANAANADIIPAAIELMRFAEFGVVEPLVDEEMDIVRSMSGQNLPATDVISWTEWAWRQGIGASHPGFPYMQNFLYGKIRPGLPNFFEPGRIWLVPRNQIVTRPEVAFAPSRALVDSPVLKRKAPEAAYVGLSDRVIGVEVNGERRAYPLRLMNYHEVANDSLGGEPIVVTFNPLTRAAYAHYRPEVEDKAVEFGVSGLMYEADSLIYDDATLSLWRSSSGRPVAGPMCADDSASARPIPLTITTWSVWRQTYPDTTVLSPLTGSGQSYGDPEPYAPYFQNPDVGFALKNRDLRVQLKEMVYAVTNNGESRAYPYSELTRGSLLYDRLGGEMIMTIFFPRRDEFRSYKIGDRLLKMSPSPFHLEEEETRSLWLITESALILGRPKSSGVELERVMGEPMMWFAWQEQHPKTHIWTGVPKVETGP